MAQYNMPIFKWPQLQIQPVSQPPYVISVLLSA